MIIELILLMIEYFYKILILLGWYIIIYIITINALIIKN